MPAGDIQRSEHRVDMPGADIHERGRRPAERHLRPRQAERRAEQHGLHVQRVADASDGEAVAVRSGQHSRDKACKVSLRHVGAAHQHACTRLSEERSRGEVLDRPVGHLAHRFKCVIGGAVRSRTDERRVTEVAVAVRVLNRMLELGRSEYVRIT